MSNDVKTVYLLLEQAEEKYGEENEEVVEIASDMNNLMEEMHIIKTKLRKLLNNQ